jgi:hypothetical protein
LVVVLRFLHLSLSMALTLAARAQTTFDVGTIRLTTEHIEFERDGETTVLHSVVRMHDVPISACIAFACGISLRRSWDRHRSWTGLMTSSPK